MASVPRALVLLAVLAASLVAAGCVERTLVVRSDPAGARLWVNGVARGCTPYVLRYVHPSRFEIRLEKEGYESVAAEVCTPTTWDAVPGPDFFAENGPSRIRRTTDASYRLTPLKRESYTQDELKAIVEAANAFRARARREAAEDGTPAPRAASPTPTGGAPRK